jgi:uncharacterized lipoprotein YajG
VCANKKMLMAIGALLAAAFALAGCARRVGGLATGEQAPADAAVVAPIGV